MAGRVGKRRNHPYLSNRGQYHSVAGFLGERGREIRDWFKVDRGMDGGIVRDSDEAKKAKKREEGAERDREMQEGRRALLWQHGNTKHCLSFPISIRTVFMCALGKF